MSVEKTKRIQITLTENMVNDLDKVGKKYNMTKSNIINLLIKKHLRGEFGDFK